MNTLKETIDKLIVDNPIDDILLMIFSSIDSYFNHKEFDIVDEFLDSLDVNHYSTEILIGFLTATYTHKHHLKSRDMFYRNVADVIKKKYPEMEANQILTGLE